MDAGTAAVVAGLGGVLLANAGQVVQPWFADRRGRSARQRADRQAAYSAFLAALDQARWLHISLGTDLERRKIKDDDLEETIRHRSVVEDTGLSAWLVAGPKLRADIDVVLERVRDAFVASTTLDNDGKKVQQADWPSVLKLRHAIREELDS